MNPAMIWIEQCEAARSIEDEFGTQKALAYLIGEKFLDGLEVADDDPTFRAEIPAFVAEIKRIFEQWQLVDYLQKVRQTERFDPSDYEDEDAEVIKMERKVRRCSANLLLVQRARELLLED